MPGVSRCIDKERGPAILLPLTRDCIAPDLLAIRTRENEFWAFQPPKMATVTTTTVRPETLAKRAKLAPENERFLRACSDIANALIQDYETQRDPTAPKKDLNLNRLRGQMSKKHSLNSQPPLTAIIAAVPEHYKKYILPKLIAKPIRKLSPNFFCFDPLVSY